MRKKSVRLNNLLRICSFLGPLPPQTHLFSRSSTYLYAPYRHGLQTCAVEEQGPVPCIPVLPSIALLSVAVLQLDQVAAKQLLRSPRCRGPWLLFYTAKTIRSSSSTCSSHVHNVASTVHQEYASVNYEIDYKFQM